MHVFDVDFVKLYNLTTDFLLIIQVYNPMKKRCTKWMEKPI